MSPRLRRHPSEAASDAASEPERWTERSPAGVSIEDAMGAALRVARAAVSPSEALLSRVDLGFSLHGPARRAAFRWRLALAALVVLLAAAETVGATHGSLRAWASRHGLVAPSVPSPASRPAAQRKSHASVAAPDLAPAPSATPDVVPVAAPPAPSIVVAEPEASRRPAIQPARTTRAPVDDEAPVPAAEEARLLQLVFHELRSETSAADIALTTLDDYDRRFPSGLLRGEARLARVEALLALGRRAEALAVLEAWREGGVALTRRARVTRGELRGDVGRCADADGDFAAVLTTSPDDEWAGRALYGRASCALRSGDGATATAALTRYLAAHPDGPHASEARDALARLGAP
jgi:hypothetical protein